jgi:hypothetical protein
MLLNWLRRMTQRSDASEAQVQPSDTSVPARATESDWLLGESGFTFSSATRPAREETLTGVERSSDDGASPLS